MNASLISRVVAELCEELRGGVISKVHELDAEAGLGRPADALTSFLFAEKHNNEDVKRRKPPVVESPIYILRRICAVEEKLNIIVEE